jgi:hypothetical protein
MSTSLTAVQQIEYDALVKAEYHSRGFLLRDSVRMKYDVIGAYVDFRKVNQVISVPTAYLQSVSIQDPGYTKETATLQKYTTPTAVDSVQELTVNFDTKMENALLVAEAMGRRSDQIIINAISSDVGDTIVDGGVNFTYVKYTQMMQFFENHGVPLGDRFVAMSASMFQSLLQADQFVSTFYTQNRVLDRAMVKEYLGFNLVIIPEMTEGGLPYNSNTGVQTALAWHKMSSGMGIGHDFRTEIHYLPRETSWLINGVFSAGAVVIDDRGTLAINCVVTNI